MRPRKPKSSTSLEELKIQFLVTGEPGYPGDDYKLQMFNFEFDEKERRKFWNSHKNEILKDFIATSPGKRPAAWWDFEAPEIRQRIGGIGDCENDVFNIVPVVTLGIPEDWIGLAWLEVYPDLTAIDPENPPVFESQATYLKRHKILTKAEKNSLKLMDFETERIKIDENINIV